MVESPRAECDAQKIVAKVRHISRDGAQSPRIACSSWSLPNGLARNLAPWALTVSDAPGSGAYPETTTIPDPTGRPQHVTEGQVIRELV